jgi:hypothetical protein
MRTAAPQDLISDMKQLNFSAVPGAALAKCRAGGIFSSRLMARKLKVFETSLGFFDLAIAAPSMKAALEAWGADSNLFHQGAARESHDPDVVAATMSRPGVILKRPVGSDGPFKENAELPTQLPGDGGRQPKKTRTQSKRRPSRGADPDAERRAALAFQKEEKRRERERRREEAAREKQRERGQRAIDKAQAAFDEAERKHDERMAAVETERDALEKRSQAEDARWAKEKEKLQSALRRARD